MSIDRQYHSYLEANGITETVEVIPDSACQVFAPAEVPDGQLDQAVALALGVLGESEQCSQGAVRSAQTPMRDLDNPQPSG